MNETFKKDTKFTVCNHDELLKRGWIDNNGFSYAHPEFSGKVITYSMIETCQGKTLTVIDTTFPLRWYLVEENVWLWPVATFIEEVELNICSQNGCQEGMTPIDGWMICKICGANLSVVKL